MKREATHTDENGNLYKVFGPAPVQYSVFYWDWRMGAWNQDIGKDFSHLFKI